MTDVSLRGKVHNSLYRPILAFALSCCFMVHAYTKFSLHRQKKKVQPSLCQFARNTQMFDKTIWRLSTANFTKKRPRNMKGVRQ